MPLKILIIDPYYPTFLSSFYSKYPDAKNLTHQKQKQKLFKELFGTADFYSNALTKIGHPGEDIILNNESLQKQWLKENGSIFLSIKDRFQDFTIKHLPLVAGKIAQNWELKILDQQIKVFKPDVIYSHNIGYLDPGFLKTIKPRVKLIVGQIACPIPFWQNFKPYDLIITSFPHYLKKFKQKGIKAEYLPLCFESSILKQIPSQKRIYDFTFIGGISRAHQQGFKLLNQLADQVKIDVWGYGKEELNPKSQLYKYHHGEAWGKDMYKLMLQSKITLNRHIDVAKNYANNTRLYEATGCGTMLLTDQKNNLSDLFAVGKEVVAYTDIHDLVKKANYYLNHNKERQKIAKAGQKRTLKDHNYQVRMTQLVEILQKYI